MIHTHDRIRAAILFAAAFLVAVSSSPSLAADAALAPEVRAMREAARAAGLAEIELPRQTPAQARAAKRDLASWERKLASVLRDRMAALGEGTTGALSTRIVQIDTERRLFVELRVADVAPFDEAFFASLGGRLGQRAWGSGYVTAWLPAAAFETVATRSDVLVVRPVEVPETNTGAILTQGDVIHNADDARSAFGLDGTGQGVGVISNGVDNLAYAQATADLPATVTVPGGCAGSGDEGTAMLEIVHDLAPGAPLAFCTGGGGTAGMVNAINTLAAIPGMRAITDDLIQPQEPMFEDGAVAAAKSAAVAAGIFYTASAGNRGGQHYQGNYFSPNANVAIGPNSYANPHDFGGGDVRVSITLAANNSIRLYWAEPFGASSIDLDLYVLDNAGNVLASSTNSQTGTEDPVEAVSFGGTAGNAAHILVDYVGGGAPPTVFFDLRAFGSVGWNEYLVPAGSVDSVARQPDIYVAGASANGTTVDGFSSRGPALRFFPGPLVSRLKPDGVGMDGMLGTGAGCFGCGQNCPPIPATGCQFFGTSASTPHVAGLAALLRESQPALTPAQVADAFNATAVDMDTPGPDNNAGYGLLDVFAAICSFDDDPPDLTCPASAVIECAAPGGTPKTDPAIQSFLSGFSATDPCDSAPTLSNDAPAFFPLGATQVTFTAEDENGNEASCTRTVTVVDTTPPLLVCPAPITVECTGDCGTPATDPSLAPFFGGVSASDACDATLTIDDDAPSCFPLGSTPVTFSTIDDAGNASACAEDVTVEDTIPPEITVTLNRDVLWPANHRLAEIVAAVEVTDICDPDASFVLTSIASDEPDDGLGDGDMADDVQGAAYGTADTEFWLRSERGGLGDGREYTITYTASDKSGNEAVAVVVVRVPHDGTGAAKSSEGFNALGTNLAPGAGWYELIVLSSVSFDASRIDTRDAMVGNTVGVVRALRSRLVDVDGDGRLDLELTFPAAATEKLRKESGSKYPVGLHYDVGDTIDFEVLDVFRLGPPVPSP